MIDPHNVQKNMTKEYLEEWILFGICVAGKVAIITARKLENLLKDKKGSPFEIIKEMEANGVLLENLKKYKTGAYTRIYKAFKSVINLDLVNLTVEKLEAIHGIGPKTARMIMLYYKPDTKCAVLDTHCLKYLKTLGYEVPKSTPSGWKYIELERIFIEEANKRNLSILEFDKQIWQAYARK